MNHESYEWWQRDGVSGYLHRADESSRGFLVLTHGAGANCRSPLLIEVADRFKEQGISVLRTDLAFRRRRASGPPSPATAAQDRAGLRDAVIAMRETVGGRALLGGHSYGGRQGSMLCADEPDLLDALLLLSYPLHPPQRPLQTRTAHFPQVRTPALFVHGDRDPFGSPEELRAALTLIPVYTELLITNGAGHDLKGAKFPLAGELPVRLSAIGETNFTSRKADLR